MRQRVRRERRVISALWRESRTPRCATSPPRPTWSRSSPGGRSCAALRDRASPAAVPSTRSGRRASPSTPSRSSTTASAAGRAAISSRSCGRPRTSTSSARSSGSPSAFAFHSSTRSRRRVSRRIAGAASGCSPCSSRRPRISSACSGRAIPALPFARTSPNGASGTTSRASSGSGSHLAAVWRRRLPRRGSRRTSSAERGWPRCAEATTSRSGSCSRSRMRAGAWSVSRLARSTRTIRCAGST